MSRPGPTTPGSTEGSRGLVLVVEDEPAIAELERRYLAREGFGVHVEADGRAGLDAARRLRPVALVLDVALPGMDGVAVCAALRERGDWTPVVFVTARDDEVDTVLGLEIGADDYLTKPFSPRELVARVKAVLRRAEWPTGPHRDPARRRRRRPVRSPGHGQRGAADAHHHRVQPAASAGLRARPGANPR